MIFYGTILSSYINAVCVIMLNATDNILHRSIESTLISYSTCSHAEPLLTYVVIFETGSEHSCYEVDVYTI